MDKKLEYTDFLESGAYVKKLEETYNRYLDARDKKLVEFMKENKQLKDQLQQKENIIKEAREKLNNYTTRMEVLNYQISDLTKKELLEILDKEVN